MKSSDEFEPGRWTYKGQKYPWALPIPHPETHEKSFEPTRPGVCPLLLVSDVEALIRGGQADVALRAVTRQAPMLRSLGRADWDEWVEKTLEKLNGLVNAADSSSALQ